MNIVVQTERLIKKYFKDFEKGKLAKPHICEVCKVRSFPMWYGTYTRDVVSLSGRYTLPIKRLFCMRCGHTFGLIPRFVEKFHRYAREVIAFVLGRLKRVSYNTVADEVMQKSQIYIGILTMYLWKKKFRTEYG